MVGLEGGGGGGGGRWILRIAAGDKDLRRRGAVDRAGVEIGAAERGGEAAGEGALAGRHRAIHGDDHFRAPAGEPAGGANSVPSPCIRPAKSGKEVATGVMSSISTGRSAARPSTKIGRAHV